MTASTTPDPTVKRMKLRYAGSCSDCGTGVPAGVVADCHRATKTVSCLACSSSPRSVELAPHPAGPNAKDDAQPNGPATTTAVAFEPPHAGTGGGSARREYERRKDNRETRIRTKHPRLGGLILAVTDDPQSTKAWAVGAKGEEILARGLDNLAADGVAVLHDRGIPDHGRTSTTSPSPPAASSSSTPSATKADLTCASKEAYSGRVSRPSWSDGAIAASSSPASTRRLHSCAPRSTTMHWARPSQRRECCASSTANGR